MRERYTTLHLFKFIIQWILHSNTYVRVHCTFSQREVSSWNATIKKLFHLKFYVQDAFHKKCILINKFVMQNIAIVQKLRI